MLGLYMQVVSQGKGALAGVLTPISSLADVQGKSFSGGPPILLLAEHVGGNEDIPEGIQVSWACINLQLGVVLLKEMGLRLASFLGQVCFHTYMHIATGGIK